MSISRLDLILRSAGLLYAHGTSERLVDDFLVVLSEPQRSDFVARYSSASDCSALVRRLYERTCDLLASPSLPSDLDV